MTIDAITTKILNSAKYKVLDKRVVTRVVTEAARRYGLKRAEDESKRLLHQIWGLYYNDAKLKDENKNIEQLLQLHQSTQERLPILRTFYERIFTIIGQPATLVDYACGLNPLAFYTLGLTFPRHYIARDIDDFTVRTLSEQFDQLGVADRFNAQLGDLLLDPPVVADVALLLKVLPCLELQRKGSSGEVLLRQTSPFVVASYPIKSVSGKEKGMAEFYRQQFYTALGENCYIVHELLFTNELVFIIDRH